MIYRGGMIMDDILYIVMPAYNEEDNIEKVIREWYMALEGKNKKSRIVVADSGSQDNTHNILLQLKKELNQLEILSNTGKQHGPKVISLYQYAISMKADYVFQTDSDGQTSVSEFDGFWKERTEYEGMFGYRKVRGDGKSRAFVEKIVCLLVKLYFGVNVPDANAPFRLMKTDTLSKYIDKLPSDYNIPNIMITTYFAYYHERIIFHTVSFKPRQGGKNSINIVKIIKIGCKALKDFKMLKKEL